MRSGHPPSLWLMTDERQGDALLRAVRALPPGSGIVFRHHATPIAERRRLFAAVLRVARARRLVLVRAGSVAMRGEMGVHGGHGRGFVTRPVHDLREAADARRADADAAFVSPVFATRTHPGARPLRRWQAVRLTRGLPAVALGGMTARRFRGIGRYGFVGWAAIDALTGAAATRAGGASKLEPDTQYPLVCPVPRSS